MQDVVKAAPRKYRKTSFKFRFVALMRMKREQAVLEKKASRAQARLDRHNRVFKKAAQTMLKKM